MPDPFSIRTLLGALAVRRRARTRGQTSLEWAIIAGGAVILALAISAIVYTVAVGWGHHIQSPSTG